MDNKKLILWVGLAFIASFVLMLATPNDYRYYDATTAYRVYLDGKSLGLVASQQDLVKHINEEQKEVKEKYNVDKVYLPNGLRIEKETTYSNKLQKTEEIYEEIKKSSSFTVKGYEIEITKQEIQEISKEEDDDNDKKEEEERYVEKTKIYVLDLDIFKNSVNEVIKSFVDEETYEKYLQQNQDEIIETGKIIENIYIEDDFVIRETNIPVDKVIFTDQTTLTAYLLFGTTETQSTYKVKSGDTIATVAENNKISTNEFLIANPDITDENSLLYEGQNVVIGLINPKFVIVEESHEVTREEVLYQTETRYNNSLYVGLYSGLPLLFIIWTMKKSRKLQNYPVEV